MPKSFFSIFKNFDDLYFYFIFLIKNLKNSNCFWFWFLFYENKNIEWKLLLIITPNKMRWYFLFMERDGIFLSYHPL